MRSGKFVLLARDEHSTTARAWPDRVLQVTVDDDFAAAAVVVRPDGFVAWATDQTNPATLDAEIHEGQRRWCGTAQRT